jgi:molecular chaperone HscB
MGNICWSCKNTVVKSDLFCPECHHIQPVHELDPFTLFGIPTLFGINAKSMADTYFIRLRQLHPDRFINKTNEEQKYAVAQSIRLNDAYRILCNPAERAAYLVELSGWNVPGQKNGKLSQEIMLQQFALRETLENVKDIKSLDNLKIKVNNEVKNCLSILNDAFQEQEKTTAQCKTVELQFLQKFQHEIEKRGKSIS